VWPEAVERVATLLRAAGAEGQLEELLPGAEGPPGLRLAAAGFDCAGRTLVALVPGGRQVDPGRLGRAAGCPSPRPAPAPEFPYAGTAVFMERTVLAAPLVWLEAGSPSHLLGLAPAQLARLTRAIGADLLRESPTGEVDDGPHG
jgi:hypothetical protein